MSAPVLVRHQPRAARTRRRVPGAARAPADRAGAVRRALAARDGRRRRPRRSPPPRRPARDRPAIVRDGRYARRRRERGRAPRAARRVAGPRGARSTPFVLWTGLWAHPISPAHVASYPLMRAIYRTADAIATYGPHVSAYVRVTRRARAGRRGAAGGRRARSGAIRRPARARSLHRRVCRAAGAGKRPGQSSTQAWRRAWICTERGELVLVGVDGPDEPGVRRVGHQSPHQSPQLLR